MDEGDNGPRWGPPRRPIGGRFRRTDRNYNQVNLGLVKGAAGQLRAPFKVQIRAGALLAGTREGTAAAVTSVH